MALRKLVKVYVIWADIIQVCWRATIKSRRGVEFEVSTSLKMLACPSCSWGCAYFPVNGRRASCTLLFFELFSFVPPHNFPHSSKIHSPITNRILPSMFIVVEGCRLYRVSQIELYLHGQQAIISLHFRYLLSLLLPLHLLCCQHPFQLMVHTIFRTILLFCSYCMIKNFTSFLHAFILLGLIFHWIYNHFLHTFTAIRVQIKLACLLSKLLLFQSSPNIHISVYYVKQPGSECAIWLKHRTLCSAATFIFRIFGCSPYLTYSSGLTTKSDVKLSVV